MKDILIIFLKALAGGSLVVTFAVLSDVLKPKQFSGLFSAAPSIAMASLVITAVASGQAKAFAAATGMIAGASGMVAYCIAASLLVARFGSVVGAGIASIAWLACAGTLYWIFLR